MVFRKVKKTRRVFRKRNYRRRRRFNRKRPNIYKSLTSKVYRFKRIVNFPDIDVSQVGPVALAFAPSLSQLPDYTDFTNLFDRYMIYKIVFRFVPRDITSVVSSYHIYTPYLHSVIDHDDDNIPTTLASIEQYSSYRKTIATKPHKRIFSPAVLSMMYESAITTGYSPQFRRWLSTNDTICPHYGIKIWIDQVNDIAATFKWTPTVTYYMLFKDVK